jgi:hypothetical protein
MDIGSDAGKSEESQFLGFARREAHRQCEIPSKVSSTLTAR